MQTVKQTTAGRLLRRILTIGGLSYFLVSTGVIALGDDGALAGGRHRLVVSTDVGGTDPDDSQSMVRLLVYADSFDIEGLVSSPYGPGRKKHIVEVIDAYERDFPNLQSYSDKYATPDASTTRSFRRSISAWMGRQVRTDLGWLHDRL
jgi:hypothetical protein